MAYKYDPPPDNEPRYSRGKITDELERWRDMGAQVGAVDFPLAAKIGSAEAVCRFELRGQTMEFRCSKFDTYGRNLTAVTLAIQSMRLNEARGIGDTIREAYAMLPAAPKHRDPWEVLGVRPDAPWEDIDAMYKIKANRIHPDKGGSAEQMLELNLALEAIKKDLGK